MSPFFSSRMREEDFVVVVLFGTMVDNLCLFPFFFVVFKTYVDAFSAFLPLSSCRFRPQLSASFCCSPEPPLSWLVAPDTPVNNGEGIVRPQRDLGVVLGDVLFVGVVDLVYS